MSTPCYICGTGMEDVKIDPRDKKIRPCSTCEAIVAETVGAFDEADDVPYVFMNSDLEEFLR